MTRLHTPKSDFRHGKRGPKRSGIILLVVLGMLTLFSVLGVSYLVFTSRQRATAFNINRAETSRKDPQPWLDETLKQILVGSRGPESSLWGHSLLADLFGRRDAVRGQLTRPTNYVVANNLVAPEVLLESFVRIPTQLYTTAIYPNQRTDHGNLPEREFPLSGATTNFPVDDSLTGRILTFTDGPLAGLSMRIVRYFGNHSGASNGRNILSGQLVLDLRPHLERSITVDSVNETHTLAKWIEFHQQNTSDISLLFYDQNATAGSGATPLADFYINGAMLNGPGLGWDVTRDNTLAATGTTMNLHETISVTVNPTVTNPPPGNVKTGIDFEGSDNGRDIPVPLQGHYALYRRSPNAFPASETIGYLQDLPSGDTDEPYDAPDDQNWWLSYFPDNPAAPVGPLGSPAPSYVRPGLIHWLVNQRASLPSPTPRLEDLTVGRLREILRAIQRATLRPIPIINDPSMPTSIPARGPGVLQLDYSNFTGGHPAGIGFGDTINFGETDPVVLGAAIRRLAEQLVGQDVDNDGKPDWDVDNTGNGVPDSVWVDAGLSLEQSDNGTLAKPLVAILIEDLGGRANVNMSGNLAQALNAILRRSDGALYRNLPVGTAPTAVTVTENNLPIGFGYGPAEIDIRPLFTHPTVQFGNGPRELLRYRLNSRVIGGVEYAAAGHLIDPLTGSGNDLPGVLRQPNLANLHRPFSAQGVPVDKFGRASISMGVNGGLMIAGSSAPIGNAGAAAGDSADDPYEFSPSPGGQPDNPFTLTDLEALLRFDDFDRDALDSELVALAENHFQHTNPNLVDDVNNARREFAHSVTTTSNSVASSVGPLPSEFRNSVAVSQRSFAPQALLTNTIVGAGLSSQQRNALLMQLLPHDILAGGKLDLNRPFGNGIDDDGDGVVDDPQELRTAVQVFYRDFTGGVSDTVYTTPYTDITVGEPGPLNPLNEPSPQAYFARHLYVMAMILARDHSGTNDVFDFSHGNSGSITIDPTNTTNRANPSAPPANIANTAINEFRAWRLAQWAINVADFRDPDAIMSRFDYDVYPYDGWDVTNLGGRPSYRTIFGMEYPELALEESLAFHDRRVRDTNLDPTMQLRFSGGSFQDNDVDQWRVPQGSLYLEVRSTRETVSYEVDRTTGELIEPAPLNTAIDDQDGDSETFDVGRAPELYGLSLVSTRSGMDANTGVNRVIDRYEPMLDLARTAPDRNPVWRIAVTRAHPTPAAVGATDRELSGDEMLQPAGSQAFVGYTGVPNRLTATLQPELPEFFGPRFNDAIDRVVWFTNVNPDNGMNGDAVIDGVVDFAPLDSRSIEKVFYNRFVNTDYPYQDTDPELELHLRGGQHMLVGPRVITHIGALEAHGTGGQTHDPTTSEPQVSYAEYESPQRILLAPNQLEHRLFTNTNATPTIEFGGGSGTNSASIGSLLGVVAAANPPSGWSGPAVAPNVAAIGLNVSEPLPYPSPVGANQYYPNPTQQLKADFPNDSYYDYDNAAGAFPDEPFDARPYAELFKVFNVAGQRTGTRERFKTAYLQRLADPTEPHDEVLNPYISVDYITIDLTVFNGSEANRQETDTGPPVVTEWIDRSDPSPFSSAPGEAFATRYKTGRTIDVAKDAALVTNENLSHSVNSFPPVVTGKTIGGALGTHNPYFDYTLNLDNTVNPDAGGNRDAFPLVRTTHSSTLGYANTSYGPRWSQGVSASAAVINYVGTPYENWFSTANWLNRPYVSPGELMWVPTTSAARFASRFGTATADTGYTAGDFYAGAGAPVGTRQEYNRAFPHLFNYFSGNANAFATSPNLWRVMDWVTVPAPYDFENDFLSTNNDILQETAPPPPPSPYMETIGVDEPAESTFGGRFNYGALVTSPAIPTGNPDSWDNTTVATPAFWLNRLTIEAFRTPANILNPPFRQGRINLNTIKNPRVYHALMDSIAEATDPAEGAFYAAFVASRRGYPAPGPIAPPVPPAMPTTDPNNPVDLNLDRQNRVFDAGRASQFAGAFRPSSVTDISPLTSDRVAHPLGKTMMRQGGTIDALGTNPLFSRPLAGGTNTDAWRARSVAHNRLALTRLNNLATDQSNVYAVWITVGLFEVDGSTLSVGKEVGSDLGQVKRYRSFQIIDRSVPVMYQPGVLNNAMDAVLISRRIQ